MKLNRFEHLLKIKEEIRYCEYEGCNQPGDFRAPRNRHFLREISPSNLEYYHWFCEAHVRAYNLQWNFYAGMNDDEILQHRYNDIFWQRPTWPIGKGSTQSKVINGNINSFDRYSIFFDSIMTQDIEDPNEVSFPIHSEESRALRLLGVQQPTTLEIVKRIYKEKAKKYHPDINGGCKHAEEKLKKINNAYQILKKAF